MTWLLDLAALAATAQPQATQPPLVPTFSEARRLSPRDLADRLLGPTGAHYREARLYDGGATGPSAMVVTLATAPRGEDLAGLCKANMMSVWFVLDRDSAVAEADMRPSVRGLSTSTVYRIVGDPNVANPTSDALGQLNRLCEAAGPVLGDPAERDGRGPFFGMSGADEYDAQLAGRALQQAQAEARAGTLTRLTCQDNRLEPDRIDCADPKALLLDLSPARITYVHWDICFETPADRCVGLSFERHREHRPTQFILVKIGVAAVDPDRQRPGLRLSGVAISQPLPLAHH